MTRTFTATSAKREHVPVLVGLMGPSGSGKTFSALRLATGMQAVTGGEIVYIDTEARRALHYADSFKFQHMQFDAPFGSLDYLDAIQQAATMAKGGIVIVDSMSHEHESVGGMLDLHEQELERLAGNDWSKRERVKMLAWQKPKANRRKLISGILQLNCNFIFCFRAKETAKPVKNPQTGKQEVVPMGFMPIAGDEFVYEMTACALLLPGAGGVPSWQSDNVGERAMIKLPLQFRDLFTGKAGRPMDEETGKALAMWARGTEAKPQPLDPDLWETAKARAEAGPDAFRSWWKDDTTPDERTALKPRLAQLQAIAQEKKG
jgi:hypothetical protein